MKELGATQLIINEAQKGVTSSVEASNRRILNLLRRGLVDTPNSSWTETLDKVVFALNASSFLYAKGGTICSPAYLHTARHPNYATAEVSEGSLNARECTVRDLMKKIAKERNLEAPSIDQQVIGKKERHRPREIILAHSEWLLMKRKNISSGNGPIPKSLSTKIG